MNKLVLVKKTTMKTITIDNVLNDRHEPSLLTIKKICKYFDVEFRDYLGE